MEATHLEDRLAENTRCAAQTGERTEVRQEQGGACAWANTPH